MVISGNGDNLGIGDSGFRIVRCELQVLLVFLRTVIASRQRKDHRIVTLELTECANDVGVIRQRVVGEHATWSDVGSHRVTAFHSTMPAGISASVGLACSQSSFHIDGTPLASVSHTSKSPVCPLASRCGPGLGHPFAGKTAESIEAAIVGPGSGGPVWKWVLACARSPTAPLVAPSTVASGLVLDIRRAQRSLCRSRPARPASRDQAEPVLLADDNLTCLGRSIAHLAPAEPPNGTSRQQGPRQFP